MELGAWPPTVDRGQTTAALHWVSWGDADCWTIVSWHKTHCHCTSNSAGIKMTPDPQELACQAWKWLQLIAKEAFPRNKIERKITKTMPSLISRAATWRSRQSRQWHSCGELPGPGERYHPKWPSIYTRTIIVISECEAAGALTVTQLSLITSLPSTFSEALLFYWHMITIFVALTSSPNLQLHVYTFTGITHPRFILN